MVKWLAFGSAACVYWLWCVVGTLLAIATSVPNWLHEDHAGCEAGYISVH